MFTEYALGRLRSYLMGQVAYAKYRVGTQYYRAEIGSAEVMSDGRVSVTLTLSLDSGGGTVTEVQLYDSGGGLLASKKESMALTAADGGILYRFRFAIREEE